MVPGNVCVVCLNKYVLPGTIESGAGYPEDWDLNRVEKDHILKVLDDSSGNKTQAARQLGIARKTLDRKLQSWNEAVSA